MLESSFIAHINDLLSKPYQESSAHFEGFLALIDGRITSRVDDRGIPYTEAEGTELTELKKKMLAKKASDTAPRVGSSTFLP